MCREGFQISCFPLLSSEVCVMSFDVESHDALYLIPLQRQTTLYLNYLKSVGNPSALQDITRGFKKKEKDNLIFPIN